MRHDNPSQVQQGRAGPLGADYIRTVAGITLNLEDGNIVEFTPADELAIPSDPKEQRDLLRKIPAQVAFWAYQAERQLRVVRELRRELAHAEGISSLTYRQWYREELDQKYTEDMISSRVSTDTKVDDLRKALTAAESTYGVLRATREAVEHRAPRCGS